MRKKAGRMPKWTKPPDELVTLFGRLMATVPAAQTRKMFGYPAAFVNGYMFAGLFQEKMFLRLSPDDQERFMKLPGAGPFEPLPGRAMRGYAVVPTTMLKSMPVLRRWLRQAYAFSDGLPPKVGKGR